MAKIFPEDIIAMGFNGEMLSLASTEAFQGILSTIIDEQARLLSARVGAAAYSATSEPQATYVARAEKCLVAAEVVRLRIVTAMGSAVPNGDEPETLPLERQRKSYLNEADGLVNKIVAGQETDSNGFSSGALISSPMAKVGDAGSTG